MAHIKPAIPFSCSSSGAVLRMDLWSTTKTRTVLWIPNEILLWACNRPLLVFHVWWLSWKSEQLPYYRRVHVVLPSQGMWTESVVVSVSYCKGKHVHCCLCLHCCLYQNRSWFSPCQLASMISGGLACSLGYPNDPRNCIIVNPYIYHQCYCRGLKFLWSLFPSTWAYGSVVCLDCSGTLHYYTEGPVGHTLLQTVSVVPTLYTPSTVLQTSESQCY